MKAAPCSWRTGTNSTELDWSSASFRSSVSSPGMPKTWRTPSFSRHWTNSWAAVAIAGAVYRRGRPTGSGSVGAVDVRALVAGAGTAGHRDLLDVQQLPAGAAARVAQPIDQPVDPATGGESAGVVHR